MNKFGNNKFGTKSEKSIITDFKVDTLREYAMINGISPKDSKGKMLSKEKLFSKIKNHFSKQQNELQEKFMVPYISWNASDINTMSPYIHKRRFQQISTADLLDALPDADIPPQRRVGPLFMIPQVRIEEVDKLPSGRIPAGSKVIRKEQGFTKQEKTKARKELISQVDDLSKMLASF